jgi:golgin subfamily B member 1
LKAIYISNLNYFKKYSKIFGLTGTLGGLNERNLVKDTYKVDFFELPRFKKYLYTY